MHQQNAAAARAHEPGAFHVVHVPQGGEGRPGDPGEAGDEHDAQGQHHVVLVAGAQDTDDDQGQQDAGKGGEGVVEAHEDLVHHAAEIAGEGAHHRAAHSADGHGGGGDGEGGAGALQHAAEDVAAEIVRTHKVMEGGAGQLGPRHHDGGVIGRPEIAHHDHQRHKARQQEARFQISVQALHASPPSRRRGSIRWLMRSATVPASTTQKARMTTMAWTTG